MNKLSIPEPVLREPGHMFVPEANMCAGFSRKQETKLQYTRCAFRNLEVARQSAFPLEIREKQAVQVVCRMWECQMGISS
jgi:hypothetical protein